MAWHHVTLTAELACQPETAWVSLTNPLRVAEWAGRLDHPISHAGQEVRLWVGPSDVYGVWVDHISPPEVLALSLSHLFVETPSTVTFRIHSRTPGKSIVNVTLGLCDATPAQIGRERVLWGERLTALARMLAGQTPYDDVDVFSVEARLPTPTWAALHPGNVARWIPFSSAGDRRGFFIIDTHGPRRFPIISWKERYDEELSLGIGTGPDLEVTRAVVRAQVLDELVHLSVVHSGWAALPIGAEATMSLRGQFRATWREAMRVAVRCAQTGRPGER